MKRGFTLIELLAVIVILAIIALIAVPIVLNIIEDSKLESQKRSIDHYAKALQQSIEKYLMKNPKEKTNLLEKIHNENLIEYDGERVECDFEYINDDGSIYLEKCKVNGVEIVGYTYGIDKRPATMKLLSKANSIDITNYIDGDTHQMYTFEHTATDQTSTLTDYRYIGDAPHNYVEFNNETWRIIGVFETETEDGKIDKRIKIIRNEKLPDNMYWGSSLADWATSSLNLYLNNDYLSVIDIKYKNMIENVKYYLGSSERYYSLTAKDYYDFERSNTVYQTNSSNTYNKIALIYPSDYAYTFANGVDNRCFNHAFVCCKYDARRREAGTTVIWIYNNDYHPDRSWIYNMLNKISFNVWYSWTISTTLERKIFDIDYSGEVYNDNQCCGNSSSNKYSLNPVLYLKSNVRIISGDGTEDNSYKLGI